MVARDPEHVVCFLGRTAGWPASPRKVRPMSFESDSASAPLPDEVPAPRAGSGHRYRCTVPAKRERKVESRRAPGEAGVDAWRPVVPGWR